MNVLVAGSSIAAGLGFVQGINDPDIWPNQLKHKLNCEIDNVSSPGYDCVGIFFLATKNIFFKQYDLILIEVPPLNRLIVRPNVNGHLDISGKITYDELDDWHEWLNKYFGVSNKDLKTFLRVMTVLNTDFEHWKKLVGVIAAAQILIKNNYNIKFINNSLDWNNDFFTNRDSDFARRIIGAEYLSDQDIQLGLDMLEQDKKLIDLSCWINPFNSLTDMRVDYASKIDYHPGKKSNENTANMIVDFISNPNKERQHNEIHRCNHARS